MSGKHKKLIYAASCGYGVVDEMKFGHPWKSIGDGKGCYPQKSGWLKIGETTNIYKRMSNLFGSCPVRVCLQKTWHVPDFVIDKDIHILLEKMGKRRFNSLNSEKPMEWFHCSIEDITNSIQILTEYGGPIQTMSDKLRYDLNWSLFNNICLERGNISECLRVIHNRFT